MRQIKFRGRDANGNFVYGDLIHYSLGECAISDGKRLTFVKPASVAQFVGDDINDHEIFEGDILIDELEQEHIATIYDRPNVIARLSFKETP